MNVGIGILIIIPVILIVLAMIGSVLGGHTMLRNMEKQIMEEERTAHLDDQ